MSLLHISLIFAVDARVMFLRHAITLMTPAPWPLMLLLMMLTPRLRYALGARVCYALLRAIGYSYF